MIYFFPSIVCLQARPASGIKGLFHRNPKQASLDSHAAALHSRKPHFGAHLLRRTASAPTKGQPKGKRGFPEISIDTKDCSSEGASSERESEEGPAAHPNGDTAASARPWEHGTNGQLHSDDSTGKVSFVHLEPKAKPLCNRRGTSEPLKRANRLKLHDSLEKQGVFTCVTVNRTGRLGMTSSCMKCMIGTKESPETERKIIATLKQGRSAPMSDMVSWSPNIIRKVSPEPYPRPKTLALPKHPEQYKPEPEDKPFKPTPMPRGRSKARQTLDLSDSPAPGNGFTRNANPYGMPCRYAQSPAAPVPSIPDSKVGQQCLAATNYGSNCSMNHDENLSKSNWSSCSSLDSLELLPTIPPQLMDKHRRAVGTLQREMNTLFAQKMEEIRSKSPLFFTGKTMVVPCRTLVDLIAFVDPKGCSG